MFNAAQRISFGVAATARAGLKIHAHARVGKGIGKRVDPEPAGKGCRAQPGYKTVIVVRTNDSFDGDETVALRVTTPSRSGAQIDGDARC